MEVAEAIRKATRILDEECERPTITYVEANVNWNELLKSVTQGQAEAVIDTQNATYVNLYAQRTGRPRTVTETPKNYSFRSANYDLLRSLFSQVNENDRQEFIAPLLSRVASGGTKWYFKGGSAHFPSFKGHVCELPLIGEFLIRNRYAKQLFASLTQPQVPTVPLAILLIQLEETIALNFNLFSEEELERIPSWLSPLRETSELQTYSSKGSVGKMVSNPRYQSGREDEANQIVQSIDGIQAECKQSLYWMLKGELQQSANLEIESDKIKVIGFLDSLGFSPNMLKSLNAAEEDYRASATEFELKSSLGHLRTFYEQLHFQVGNVLADKVNRARDEKFGQVLISLRFLGFFTEKEEKFAAGLYGLLSTEAVHALFAKRDYARLMRNMVIEYGVMFLSMMDNKNIKIAPESP
jgi:hypothetical protein